MPQSAEDWANSVGQCRFIVRAKRLSPRPGGFNVVLFDDPFWDEYFWYDDLTGVVLFFAILATLPESPDVDIVWPALSELCQPQEPDDILGHEKVGWYSAPYAEWDIDEIYEANNP